jgi:hypothetical protein
MADEDETYTHLKTITPVFLPQNDSLTLEFRYHMPWYYCSLHGSYIHTPGIENDLLQPALTLSHTHMGGSRSEPPMSLLLVLAFCQQMA